jgi:dihydrodipicolinate synthase/N-acetylneuraminate lyase
MTRREFHLLWAALPAFGAPGAKTLRGIFPIAQTPFTKDDKLDLDALAAEVRFIDRGGVHGFVWPQLASEYSTLSEAERLAGAEAILAAAKGLRPAIVIGVQAPAAATAVNYARHAARLGADALIALPPAGVKDPEAILAYYREIGQATDRPLFAQAIGDMSVEFLVRMAEAIFTLAFVKDEAGPSPLGRVGPILAKTRGKLNVFTGGHGGTLIDEMRRGIAGSMPAASFADLYAAVWDKWQAGRHDEALDLFGKTLLLVTEIQVYGVRSLKYLLHLRGVFPTWEARGRDGRTPFDESAQQTLRRLLDYVKPHLKA